MALAPQVANTTLRIAVRAFARHRHADAPFTRDLHHLRSLHRLCVETLPHSNEQDRFAPIIESQKQSLREIERAHATWRDEPDLAARNLFLRQERLLGFVVTPATIQARRPGLIDDMERSIADLRIALQHDPAVAEHHEPALQRFSTLLAQQRTGITEIRRPLSAKQLTEALTQELERALDASEALPDNRPVRLAFAADRVLEAWRQLIPRVPRPPWGLRVREASSRLAQNRENEKQWEQALSDDTGDFVLTHLALPIVDTDES